MSKDELDPIKIIRAAKEKIYASGYPFSVRTYLAGYFLRDVEEHVWQAENAPKREWCCALPGHLHNTESPHALGDIEKLRKERKSK